MAKLMVVTVNLSRTRSARVTVLVFELTKTSSEAKEIDP